MKILLNVTFRDIKNVIIITWPFIILNLLLIYIYITPTPIIGAGIYLEGLELRTKVDIANITNKNTFANQEEYKYTLYEIDDNNVTSTYSYYISTNSILYSISAPSNMISIKQHLYKRALHLYNIDRYGKEITGENNIYYFCTSNISGLLFLIILIVLLTIGLILLYIRKDYKKKYNRYNIIYIIAFFGSGYLFILFELFLMQ